MKIIGFAGRKRSGKDTLCDVVAEMEPKHHKFLIANSLKQLCCDLLNIDFDTLTILKDSPNAEFEMPIPDTRWCNVVANRTGVDVELITPLLLNRKIANVRELLQVLGTDIIRKYKPDWHIDETIKDMLSYPDDTVCLVTDVRFPNELTKLTALGAEIYFVARPRWLDVSNHLSETALRWHMFDENHIIINDGTLENFTTAFKVAYAQSNPRSLVTSYANLKHQYNANPLFFNQAENDPNLIPVLDAVLKANPQEVVQDNAGYDDGLILDVVAETDNEMLDMKKALLSGTEYKTTNPRHLRFYDPLFIEELKRYW